MEDSKLNKISDECSISAPNNNREMINSNKDRNIKHIHFYMQTYAMHKNAWNNYKRQL